MTPTPKTVARVVCSVAALALLAASGCNRGKKYPTINAHNPDGGGVSVKGTYNHCPQVYFSASPDHTRVGQTIALTVSASDEENDPLKYTWTVSPGATIENATAANTTLHCIARGSVTITLTVSDGSCDNPVSGSILCQSGDAGADEDGGAAGAGGSSGSGQAGASGQAGTTGQAGTSGQAGTTGQAGATGQRTTVRRARPARPAPPARAERSVPAARPAAAVAAARLASRPIPRRRSPSIAWPA